MAGKPNSKWMETMIEKHGSREAVSEFMAGIGGKGGKAPSTGGFAADIECNCSIFHYKHFIKNCAGSRGGKISRRKKHLA